MILSLKTKTFLGAQLLIERHGTTVPSQVIPTEQSPAPQEISFLILSDFEKLISYIESREFKSPLILMSLKAFIF